MSKRRRASSAASRGADGDESDDGAELSNPGPPPSRKKKKLDPGELCQQLYDTIRSFKKEDGTLLCDSFIRAPKRRQEPHYYEVVSQPIDLLRVQQKLKTDTYEDIEELSADIELLVNNAKAFYKTDTVEYRDAEELWKLYTQTRRACENGEDIKTTKLSRNGSSSRRSDIVEDMSETSTNNEEDNVYEELFNAVMIANIDGRPLYPAFQFLPSKRRYPEYYNVIDSPIDLKTIAQKIQGGEYTNLGELERDLLLMVRNACHFNEPGSQIYKDAKTLKKVIQLRKQELDQHGRGGLKSSERIRSKRTSRVGPVPSSRTLAIMDPPGSDTEYFKHSEDSGDSDDDKNENEDSPQWKLLETVRNHLTSDGRAMAEPFLKLPSRRAYPDYYKEIKNPMSLNQIKNKIRRGNYGTLSEVAGDMNIMFENAKQYNVPTSRLYKDAVKLQRLMQQRVQELLDIVQSSSSDDESLSSVKNQTQSTPRPRGRPRINPLPGSDRPSPVPTPIKTNLPLKKKLHYISKQLVEFTCSDGRQPMLLFMEKPSKKLYPEYYSVIERPIDMICIENNIKHDRYNSVEEMVSDFRVMFSNCRQFNEEGSMIYEDANLLERFMNEKVKEVINGHHDRKTPVKQAVKSYKPRQLSPFEQKLRTLYDAIRDYRDPKANRQLALIFMKLPSKTEYPDYYELIKNPIDMEKIAQKLKNGLYHSVNELASDFILMFDNACKYNEPDSQIYKDALILHRVCLQTKQMLSREDDDAVPDVPAAVQDLLLNLFTSVYNHQDEEGRCYSDSMAELPEHDESPNGEKVRAISLDLVKRRLDRGLYKRLDHFQQDMFAVFERARRISRTDSQIFEDSVELQSYYIAQRDLLCRNTLSSPALAFTKDTMATSVELVKQCKLLQENPDEDESRSSTDDSMLGPPVQQSQYTKGDFVYVQPEKGNKEPSIVHIDRVWTNKDGVPMIYANVYFRPQETFHVRTRKFLQQEVFKTEAHRTIPLDQIIGYCYVMNVKEYFRFKPQGFLDKDVYVCESRYNTKNRWFKKIKIWESSDKDILVPREVPLEPSRTVSVFRERVEKHKDELAELEVLENVQEKERPDVVMYNPLGTDDENTYYEQYNTVCSGVIKTGDYVYVVTDGGKQMIAQVDTIWETGDNKCYFRGPFLIFPSEVANIISKPFYKQEVLLTTIHDTSPLVGIVGKCSVLDYDDYLKSRVTEIAENDVYVCECVYDESNRVARKLKSGLRKFEHTKDVTVDEIYNFPKPLGPPALASSQEVQSASSAFTQKQYSANAQLDSIECKPQFTNLINTTIGSQDVEMLLENSLDDSSLASPATPLSIGGNSNPYNPSMSTERTQSTPATGKKKKEPKQKIVTGYILYSSEVRKAIIANNPDSTFGEISRIVGNEWRSLPASTKQSWEERAAKCNEETSARLAEEMRELTAHIPMEMTYECAWDTCDYQFEDLQDCLEHCVGDGVASSPGHVQSQYRGGSSNEYPCVWRSCARVRKGQAPFPNLPRLLRHVRDLHVNKGNGRMMAVHERSRNFVPSTKKKATSIRSGVMSPGASLSGMSGLARNTPSPVGGAGAGPAPAPPTRPALDPLFVLAPPRAQRVTHSEAYIRYIEGLHSEQKYITPWEKSLTPMPINPDPAQFNMQKLPAHWMTEDAINGYLLQDKTLSETNVQKMDQTTKILKGLCALRDFMMKDALCVYKNYN